MYLKAAAPNQAGLELAYTMDLEMLALGIKL